MNLTKEAVAGYTGHLPAPAYPSSPVGHSCRAGQLHRAAGRPLPRRAKMSQGYAVRIDGSLYNVK